MAARSAGTGGGADLSPRRRGPNFVLEPLNLRLRHRITMAVSSLQLLSLLGRAPRAVCAHMKKTGTGGTRIERKSCSELLLCPPMASVLPHLRSGYFGVSPFYGQSQTSNGLTTL